MIALTGMSELAAEPPALARQRRIAVASLLLLAAAAAIGLDGPPTLRVASAIAGLALAGFAFSHPGPGSAVAVLAAAIEVVCLAGVLWQIAMPLALAALAVAARREPRLSGAPLRLGDVPAGETLVCALVTPGALAGWVLLWSPDLRDITDAIPRVSAPVLLTGAVAFAGLNALFEEWIWRGVIQSRLAAIFPVWAAIAVQAASFGAAHAHGFPRGPTGVLLAGAWGAMLGVLRLRSRGLLAPVVAHVVADSTIAAIVLLWLRT